MASKRFIATNALVKEAKRTSKGGSAKIKFQLTAKVAAALGWPEMPEGTGEWTPEVQSLQATLIELTPNNVELAKHAMTIDATSIGDFQVQRKDLKSGKNAVKASKKITEVVCIVKFADPIGVAKLEQYLQSAARSEMLVCYTPAPQQDDLPGTRVDMTNDDEPELPFQTPERAAAVAEIPNSAEETTEEMAARVGREMAEIATGDDPEEEDGNGATLGSALAVVGGTHAKRGRGRPRKYAASVN